MTHYLWKAANSFFYTGDPEARAWVRDQTAKILDGKHRDVRAGIRRRATACGYSPAERAGADECADYLEHKQDYLDYPAFLAAGWPVECCGSLTAGHFRRARHAAAGLGCW